MLACVRLNQKKKKDKLGGWHIYIYIYIYIYI
jgi:hypothetical protein